MYRYFATFPSGAQELVGRILEERFREPELYALLDGGVEFGVPVPYSDLNLFCFHNVFQVVHSQKLPLGPHILDDYLRELLRDKGDWAPVREHPAKMRTFRLVASCQNRLAPIDPSLRGALEKRVARLSGLRVDRSRPDAEFWLLSRDDGTCRFLKRLSRHTSYEKLLDPGELHPELAYLMCWLSGPKHTDVVLDPFCGYGSIPSQRCRRFPYSKIYAFDKDGRVLRRAGEKLGPARKGLSLEQHDVLDLSRVLPPDSVDAVITDPPWGLFREVGMGLEEFYRQSLFQLVRVLKPGGRLVLLTAGKEELLGAAEAVHGLSLRERHDLLVSGKKAGLFLLEKDREFLGKSVASTGVFQ